MTLVIGWSDAVASMLSWFEEAAGGGPPMTVLSRSQPRAAARTSWREGNPADPAQLAAALEATGPELVLVASEPGSGGDAAAILAALHVCRALGDRRVPVLVEQRGRPSTLAEADPRLHVVSGPALAGETIALAVLDPLALAAQEALAGHRVERRRLGAVPAGATFGDLYAALLERGSVPFALARDGRALDLAPATPLRAGDDVLVVYRRAAEAA